MLLYIIGFTRAGKSTFAQDLSAKWQIPAWDTDDIFCKMQQCSIDEYVNLHGFKAFRKQESLILAGSLQFDKDFPPHLPTMISGIVSCGGGIVEDPHNRAFLARQRVIWLFCPWDTIQKRILKDPSAICKLHNLDELKQLYLARMPMYLECLSTGYRSASHDPKSPLNSKR